MDKIAYEKPRILGKPTQMMTWVRCPICGGKVRFPFEDITEGREVACDCGHIVYAERRTDG